MQINLLTVIFLIYFWNLTLLIKQYQDRNPHLPTSRLKDDYRIKILPEWVGRVMVLHFRTAHITVWICVKPRAVQTPWQPRAELDYITAMANWWARWQIMLHYDEKVLPGSEGIAQDTVTWRALVCQTQAELGILCFKSLLCCLATAALQGSPFTSLHLLFCDF